MPKIRGIKPETWTDDKFVELSPLARLLFLGMWNYACDNGHIDNKPRQLKIRILPADDANVPSLLDEMVDLGMVEKMDGYLFIPNLPKHQKIDRRYLLTCDHCEAPADDAQVARIYYARAGEHIKIGQTTQPVERRIAALRSISSGTVLPPDADPKSIELLGSHPVTDELTESRIHWQFRASRTPWGEWFEVTEALLEHIAMRSTQAHSRVLTSTHAEGRKEGVDGDGDGDRSTASKSRKKTSSRLPSSWAPTSEHIERAIATGVDLGRQVEKFRAHAEANDRRQANWNAAFTQWLINAAEFAERDRKPVESRTSTLRAVEDISEAPSGLSDDEYRAWYLKTHGGRG